MDMNWGKVRYLDSFYPGDHGDFDRCEEVRPFDDLVAEAKKLAELAHRGQRYGDRPYTWHLRMVVGLTLSLEFDPFFQRVLIMAAWLHDVIEDTKVELSDLEPWASCGARSLVWAMTGEGRTREERVRSALPKIEAAGPVAVYLKVCDRLANVLAAMADQNEKFTMYQAEYPEFCRYLRSQQFESQIHSSLLNSRWRMLDSLSGTLALQQVQYTGEA